MGYPTTPIVKQDPRARGQKERSEALTGFRNDEAPLKEAVTRGDAAALGIIKLQAMKIDAAPTAAQYNALVDDIRQLAAALNKMGATFVGF